MPGACALTFKRISPSRNFLQMTLGLTQPLRATDPSFPWEFSVFTNEPAEWSVDLLYQLVTQWLCEERNMGFGYHLPLVFFTDPNGKLWAGISNDVANLNVVGSLRGLYLWTDATRLRFGVPSGEFGLLTVVGVTGDEDNLARDTTPAHLMLLLRRMGVDQVCNPHRRSVLTMPGAVQEWKSIKTLSHDDAFEELQGMISSPD